MSASARQGGHKN